MIQRLAPCHLHALTELEAQARSGASPALLSDALEAGEATLDTRVLGYWQTESLAGYALVVKLPFEAELQAIGVLPECRGQRLGAALLGAVIDQARAWQSERLLLEVREGNAVAIRLYERAGFGVDGRRRHYYPAVGAAGREDALLMSRAL